MPGSCAPVPDETIMIAGKLIRQGFDSYIALQLGVPRPIDFTHSAGADQTDDFILSELRTWI